MNLAANKDGGDSSRHKRRSPQPAREDPRRLRLKEIAQSTIDAMNLGHIDVPAGPNTVNRHDIKRYIIHTQQYTKLYPEDSPNLRDWRTAPPRQLRGPGAQNVPVTIERKELSTIKGIRYLHAFDPVERVGVLNFASATKPGGGFLNGARAQEESIARSSSLYASLITPAAQPFYASHHHDEKGGYYSHAIIYSPNVVIFRDDDGRWFNPIKVDVATSPAVNAGQVRKTRRRSRDETEGRIQEVMQERMARILTTFEGNGVRNLVLGSFGTGVFQNDVRAMAEIWRDLFQVRFSTSFDRVVFAIPDRKTLAKFESGFNPRHRPRM